MRHRQSSRIVILAVSVWSASVLVAETTDSAWGTRRGFLKRKSLADAVAASEAAGHFAGAAKLYRKMANVATGNDARAYALSREADCWVADRKFYRAFDVYAQVLRSYAGYVDLDHVLARVRELAVSFDKGNASLLGFSDRTKAIDTWKLVLQYAPRGAHAAADNMKLARLYRQSGELTESAAIYRRVIRDFPQSEHVPEARMRLAKVLLRKARGGDADGEYARQARLQLEAYGKFDIGDAGRDSAEKLLVRTSEAEAHRLLEMGRFYVQDAHYRPAAARRYLHDVTRYYPNTPAAEWATTALVGLEAKEGVAPTTPVHGVGGPPPEGVSESRPVAGLGPGGAVQKWLLPLDDLGIERD